LLIKIFTVPLMFLSDRPMTHTHIPINPLQHSYNIKVGRLPEYGADVPVIMQHYTPLLQSYPIFTSIRPHQDYVDCVRWFGYVRLLDIVAVRHAGPKRRQVLLACTPVPAVHVGTVMTWTYVAHPASLLFAVMQGFCTLQVSGAAERRQQDQAMEAAIRPA
jgi:hypothetical protein